VLVLGGLPRVHTIKPCLEPLPVGSHALTLAETPGDCKDHLSIMDYLRILLDMSRLLT
jgi:hypothetical protein